MLHILSIGLKNLFHLDTIYEKGNTERKRGVIGSMYPDKLTFDGFTFRTARLNEAARLIYSLDKALSENKKGQSEIIPALSSQVGKTGFEPATPWSQTRCATGLRYFPGGCAHEATSAGQRNYGFGPYRQRKAG